MWISVINSSLSGRENDVRTLGEKKFEILNY